MTNETSHSEVEDPAPEAAATADAEAQAQVEIDALGEVAEPGPSAKLFSKEGLKDLWKDLISSLSSSDGPTRRVARLFFASVLGLTLVFAGAGYRVYQLRHRPVHELTPDEEEIEHQKELAQRHAEEEKVQLRTIDLGRFVIALDDPHVTADFELTVRCNEKEVREYFETHQVELKSEVTAALLGSSKEDFLSPAGKRRIRKKLIHRLDEWAMREYRGAHVEEVYFPNLTVNGG